MIPTFEVGKFYKDRKGDKVQVVHIAPLGFHPLSTVADYGILGVLKNDNGILFNRIYTDTGKFLYNGEIDRPEDLIEEWRDPVVREYDIILCKKREGVWGVTYDSQDRMTICVSKGLEFKNQYWEEVSRQTVKFVET